MSIYTGINTLSSLAQTAVLRSPGYVGNLMGLAFAAEGFRRVAATLAGGVFNQTIGRIDAVQKGADWAEKNEWTQFVYKWTGAKAVSEGFNILRDKSNKEIVGYGTALLAFSMLYIEGSSRILPPAHPGYNLFLQTVSPLRLSEMTPLQFIWNTAKDYGIVGK